jgi:hypothetical protein
MGDWRSSSTILDLGSRLSWVVSCTPRALYPREKRPQCPLDRRLGGPQNRSERCTRRIEKISCRESNPGHPVRSPSLCWLSYPGSSKRKKHLIMIVFKRLLLSPHYAYVDAPEERSGIHRNMARLPWDQNWNNGTDTSTGESRGKHWDWRNNGGNISYHRFTYMLRKALFFHFVCVLHLLQTRG